MLEQNFAIFDSCTPLNSLPIHVVLYSPEMYINHCLLIYRNYFIIIVAVKTSLPTASAWGIIILTGQVTKLRRMITQFPDYSCMKGKFYYNKAIRSVKTLWYSIRSIFMKKARKKME